MSISAARVTRMGMAGGIWQPQGSYANKVEGAAPAPAPAPTLSFESAGGGAVSGSQWKRYADIRRKRIIEDNEELLNLCKQAYFDIIKKYFDR